MRLRTVFSAIRPWLGLCLSASACFGIQNSTTTISSSANPVVFGHSVTLTATITPASATGTVTFFDGTSVIGISHVFLGKASAVTSLLLPGVRSIKAYFTGDNNNVGSTSPIFKQTVTPLANQGFQGAINLPDETAATFVAVSDLNGDGITDLAVLVPTQDTTKLVVLIGVGDGTFKLPISIDVGNGANAIAIADFTGDGRPDIAVSNATTNSVFLIGNAANGNFVSSGTFPTGASPTGMAVSDLNGDGVPDIAVSTNTGVSILYGLNGGGFQAPVAYGAGLSSGIAIADTNGDGYPDLVLASPSGVGVMIGFGNGSFLAKVNYPTGVGGGPLAVADFDGDGRLDIAAVSNSSVSVALANPDGTFKKAVLSPSGAPNAFIQSLAVGDFNGDGKVDLLAVNYSGVPSTTNATILIGNGDGTFQAPIIINVPAVTFATVGDINGDGAADLIMLGGGPLEIFLAIPVPIITPPPPTPPSVASGGVLNAASFAKDSSGKGTAVAPGSLVAVFGNFPGAVQADATGVPFQNSLGGVSVTFNNIPAPVRDVIPAANEINVQLPFELQSLGAVGTANVVVTIAGLSSTPVPIPIISAAPGIFTIPPTGLGNAVLVFSDPNDNVGKIAAPVAASATFGLPTAPVPRGSPAYFYVTGLGALNPSLADGAGGSDVTRYATFPTVTIGSGVNSVSASVQFAGQAPGFPGVNQVNIIVPSNAPTGDAVSIQVKSADGSVSSNIATIAIR